jgi:hypothetical protein
MVSSAIAIEEEVVRGAGLGVDDLNQIYRSEYLHAVEIIRQEHDPTEDWDGFVEALWQALVPAFGLDVETAAIGEVEPDGLARGPSGSEGR